MYLTPGCFYAAERTVIMIRRIRSRVSLLLLFAVICTVLSGCRIGSGEVDITTVDTKPGGTVTSVVGTKTPDDSTAAPDTPSTGGTVPSVTSTPEPERISFSTTEGVVLVGRIEKDDCFYFVPDQVLDIECTELSDTVLKFSGITRLDMFDTDIDGIDKMPYVGKQVTVGGILRTIRGNFEKPYLHAYFIENGNTAGKSHAEPEITPPVTEPETKYDPSVPLPSKMMPRTENGHYVYNPYRLPTEALESLGNGFADVYIEVVDAVLGYKNFVACDDDYAMMLSTVLYCEFPLYGVTFECEYSGNGGVSLRYFVSRGEQEKLAAELFGCINGYLKSAKPGQSEQMKAEIVYHALCTAVSYDKVAAETRKNIEPYYAYVKKIGICVTFAAAYSQLLTQVGIENTEVTGSDIDGDGHAWNLVTIDGKKYFCDPTFELNWKNGSAFVYFGRTTADRVSNGFPPENCTVGKYMITSVADAGVSERALQIISLQ